MGPVWGSLPGAQTALQHGGQGAGRRRLSLLVRSPKEVRFAVRKAGCWRDAGAFRLPWESSRKGRPPPSPIPPAPGDPPTCRPGLTHRQRPASQRPGPRASGGGTHPEPTRSLPSGPGCSARSARLPGRGSTDRTRQMDQPVESFLRGKRRDGAGRGGGGGEEKGRQRKGRGGVERPAGVPRVPRRKRLGRPVPGTRPQVANNNNDNDEDGVLPRCQAMG